jgi:hypothetical protein
MDERPHLFFGLIGGAVGFGVAKLASISPGISQRWPSLFTPFWGYMLPIGLLAAAVGGAVAALLTPPRRGQVTADLAAVAVCIAVSRTMLADRPGLFALFLLTIGYGFVGHVVGSIVAAAKATTSVTE